MEVALPAGVTFESTALGLIWPGQVAHASPFTGETQVLNRAAGIWRGTSRIPVAMDDAARRAVERFLASMDGRANWVELPINRPTMATADRPTISSSASSAAGLVTVFAGTDPAYNPGDYLRVGPRLALVDARTAARRYILRPQAVFATGGVVSPGLTVRARRASAAEVLSPGSPDFYGPWVFDWIEAI